MPEQRKSTQTTQRSPLTPTQNELNQQRLSGVQNVFDLANTQIQGSLAELDKQYLEALRTGGVNAQIPILSSALSGVKRAGSANIQQLQERLRRSNLLGTPEGERILNQATLQARQAESTFPSQFTANFLQQGGQTLANFYQAARQALATGIQGTIPPTQTGEVTGYTTTSQPNIQDYLNYATTAATLGEKLGPGFNYIKDALTKVFGQGTPEALGYGQAGNITPVAPADQVGTASGQINPYAIKDEFGDGGQTQIPPGGGGVPAGGTTVTPTVGELSVPATATAAALPTAAVLGPEAAAYFGGAGAGTTGAGIGGAAAASGAAAPVAGGVGYTAADAAAAAAAAQAAGGATAGGTAGGAIGASTAGSTAGTTGAATAGLGTVAGVAAIPIALAALAQYLNQHTNTPQEHGAGNAFASLAELGGYDFANTLGNLQTYRDANAPVDYNRIHDAITNYLTNQEGGAQAAARYQQLINSGVDLQTAVRTVMQEFGITNKTAFTEGDNG